MSLVVELDSASLIQCKAMAASKEEVQNLIRKNSPRIALQANTDSRARSKAWDKFHLVTLDGVSQPYAVCKDCQTVYKWNKRDGTSAMSSHSCGPLKKSSQRQGTLTAFVKQPPSSLLVEVKRKMTEKSALCAAKELRPYLFVEGAGMREWAQTLLDVGAEAAERGFRLKADQVLPSAVTVGREVHRQAELERQKLKANLSEVSYALYNISI